MRERTTWTDDHTRRLNEMRDQGVEGKYIAEVFGMSLASLRQFIFRKNLASPEWRIKKRGGATKKAPVGPRLPTRHELRVQRRADKENRFLECCESHADAARVIPGARVIAAALGWDVPTVRKTAHILRQDGRFLYTFCHPSLVPFVPTSEVQANVIASIERHSRPVRHARPPQTPEEAVAELARWMREEVTRCRRMARKHGWTRNVKRMNRKAA